MSMAINRSVDFSKINSNVSLVPTFETKKLLDVMSEPIDCIRTLQNTVSIKARPLPLNICPYIILDEMWVKESLLCLLSNSVKYSNGGVIIINTEIIPHLHAEGIHRESDHPITMDTIAEGDNRDDDGTEPGNELSYIRVSVIDNGVGIPFDRRQNIFQSLRPSTKPTGKMHDIDSL
jgi:signal transduction histidine kinase